MIVEDRLNFNNHVECSGEEGGKVVNTLYRIMSNFGGARSSKRHLLPDASSFKLRYGVPARTVALRLKQSRTILTSTFRLMAIVLGTPLGTPSGYSSKKKTFQRIPLEIISSYSSIIWGFLDTSGIPPEILIKYEIFFLGIPTKDF